MIVVDELEEAATKAVAIANIVKQAEDVKIDVQVNSPSYLPL